MYLSVKKLIFPPHKKVEIKTVFMSKNLVNSHFSVFYLTFWGSFCHQGIFKAGHQKG